MPNTAVFGIYPNRIPAELAVAELQRQGFRAEDISVLISHSDGGYELGIEKNSKAPEGATTGGASGAVLGGTLGWLVGVGALVIPGLGAFVAAGPLMATLGGAAVGGATGGIAGAVIGAGIPEFEAKRYEELVGKGNILLSVHADDAIWVRKAQGILEQTGAENIASTPEAPGDLASNDRPTPRNDVL